MILTHNQQAHGDSTAPECAASPLQPEQSHTESSNSSAALPATLQLLNNQISMHDPHSGLNPAVDAAGNLFAIMGHLQTTQHCTQLSELQKELLQEINVFQETAKLHGYKPEYMMICSHVMCSVIDELIANTAWGGNNQWDQYSLLGTLDQSTNHQEQFFDIMERTIKEPEQYIDLMELMYICLSMGYRGEYQGSEQNQIYLDEITNALYKYIRAYRGNFSILLSPAPLSTQRPAVIHSPQAAITDWTVPLFTGCIIMILFISLSYLMEIFSNETISNFTDIQKTAARNHLQQ